MRGMRWTFSTVLLFAACSGGDREWGGTVSDSAGVAVVQNPADASWTLQQQPQLVEELSIGSEEGDPAYQFGTVIALDVDEAGRIYVLDQQAGQVRVFDREGQHVRTVGKLGGGPGELSAQAMSVLAGANDVVYVADLMRQRIAALGPDGIEVGSTPLSFMSGLPMRFELTPEKQFVMQTRAMRFPGMPDTVQMKDRILKRDPASEQADTLLELESGRTIEFGAGGIPKIRLFQPEPVWTIMQDGRIAHGRNDTFRIEILGQDGALQRIITRPVERRPVTEADRTAFLDLIKKNTERQMQGVPPEAAARAQAMVQQMLQQTEFADYYPAYFTMMGGPGGTLWVQRVRTAEDAQRDGGTFDPQDAGSGEWDIFDAEGRLLGMIKLPDRFAALRVRGDHIYGRYRDELDLEHVVRLRVDGLTTRAVQREGQ